MNKVFTVKAYIDSCLSYDDDIKAMYLLMPTLKNFIMGNDWVYLLQGMTVEEIEREPLTNENGDEHQYLASENWTEPKETAILLSHDEVFKALDSITDELFERIQTRAKNKGMDVQEYVLSQSVRGLN